MSDAKVLLMANDAKVLLTVDIDCDTEDVVFSCRAGEWSVTQRCRVLHGWLLLYLLDPEPFDEIGRVFCETSLATAPPVGLIETNELVLLELPNGSIKMPAERQAELKEALAAKLMEFGGSLGWA